MDKRFNAAEVNALYMVAHVATTSTDAMRLAHFNHLVARLSELGLCFEDVMEAGMARLLNLRPRDISDAWGRQPRAFLVSTESWRFYADFYLRSYGDLLTHRDRTYLEMMLSRQAILANDMLELEQVLHRAFEVKKGVDWGERMEELRSPADEAAPAEQLDLDV